MAWSLSKILSTFDFDYHQLICKLLTNINYMSATRKLSVSDSLCVIV